MKCSARLVGDRRRLPVPERRAWLANPPMMEVQILRLPARQSGLTLNYKACSKRRKGGGASLTLHIPIQQHNELDKAIIARDILAEGYITYVSYALVKYGRVYAEYALRVEFVSAEEEYARDFLMRAGGRLEFHPKPRVWRVVIEGKRAKRLLEAILPYLVGAKRRAAEMALALKHPSHIPAYKGRPPLPRHRRPPLAKHSPAGRKWAEFYERHGHAPTVEEWKAIR